MSESRNPVLPDITFAEADFDAEVAWLEEQWHALGGGKLHDASPERLFIQLMAVILVQQNYLIDRAAKRNLPRYAEGAYLDSLSDIFSRVSRLQATAASATIRFETSTAVPSVQLIPAGTRIRSRDGKAVFVTQADVSIPRGGHSTEARAVCDTAGAVGNGYAAGEISELVDEFPYYERCANIVESEGGADAEDDDSLYERMRLSMEGYTTAGSTGAYEYWAKSVSALIGDAKAVSPRPCWVTIYVLLKDGSLPGQELLDAVLEECSKDHVKAQTDVLEVKAPGVLEYDIDVTWYVSETSDIPTETVQRQVAQAVEAYKAWQSAQMGRHINPTKLVGLLVQAGASRVEVASPSHQILKCDKDGCEVARCASESVVWGGYCE